jgi:hypothetical protein
MVLAMLEGTPPSELVFGLAGEGDSLCTCKAVAAGKLTEPGGGVGGNTRGSPKRTVGADCPEPDGGTNTPSEPTLIPSHQEAQRFLNHELGLPEWPHFNENVCESWKSSAPESERLCVMIL